MPARLQAGASAAPARIPFARGMIGTGGKAMRVRDAICVGVGALAVALWTLYNYVAAA